MLTPQQIQQMDQVSGLSQPDIANMDKIVGGQSTQPQGQGGIGQALGDVPILGTLLGNSFRTAQDVGTGIRSMMEQPNLHKNEQMAQQLETQAMQTQDMQQRKDLLAQANQIRSGISGEAQNIGQNFTRDVGQNPLWRGVKSGTEIANVAEIPSMVKGGVNFVKNVGSKLPPSLTYKGVGNAITQAGKESPATIDYAKVLENALSPSGKPEVAGQELRQAIQKAAENYVPELKPQVAEAATSINPSSLVDKFGKPMQTVSQEIGGAGNATGSVPEALGIRGEIAKTYGNNIFNSLLQKLGIGSSTPGLSEQGVQAFRNALTEAIHEAAPATKNPDYWYGAYKRMGGSPAQWAVRSAIGIPLYKALAPIIGHELASKLKGTLGN